MAEANPGPSSANCQAYGRFFDKFFNSWFPKHPEAQGLVKLQGGSERLLHLENYVRIAEIYCDHQDENKNEHDKKLDRKLKNMKDNFKNIMAQFSKRGFLEKFSSGTRSKKQFLVYKIKDDGLWSLLKQNYPSSEMVHDGTSSETSGIGVGQSDDSSQLEKQQNIRDPRQSSSNLTTSTASATNSLGTGSSHTDHTDPPKSVGALNEQLSEFSFWPSDNMNDDQDAVLLELFPTLRHLDTGEVQDFTQSDGRLVSKISASDGGTSPDTGLGDHERQSDQELSDKGGVEQSDVHISEELPYNHEGDNSLELVAVPCFSVRGMPSTFCIRGSQNLPCGEYRVQYGKNGSCKASGNGSKLLDGGSQAIPEAKRRGTHPILGTVFMQDGTTEKKIGNFPFMYIDTNTDTAKQVLESGDPWSSDGRSSNEPRDRPQKNPSSESEDHASTSKKMRKIPIDMPMLMYLCDEMAKRGDEEFFRALIKLGILADVLANPNEYFKSFAVTAREHGHGKLAELIAMSPRELSSDCLMEKLTLGTLVDAVQTERSLTNSVYSSDDDSDSSLSGYNGDCDSEDDALSSDLGSDDDDDSRIRIIPQEFLEREINFEIAELEKEANYEILELEVEQVSSKIAGSNSDIISFEDSPKFGKCYEVFELEKEANYEILELEVEQVSSKIAGSNSATISWIERLLREFEQRRREIELLRRENEQWDLEKELADLLSENERLRRENERLVEKEKFTFGISGHTFFSIFLVEILPCRWWNTNEQEAEPEQILRKIEWLRRENERLRRENERLRLKLELAVVRGNERLQRILQNELLRRENESQRQIERKRNVTLRLEKFGSVNVLGQYKSRGGRWKVMLMSVGSGCGQSLWQEYLKSMGKANSNSLTHCIEGFPDPCLDTSIFSKKCFSKVVKLISVDRCNENRNSSQMNEQIEQFVDINRDPVDELQSIGAKDVESIAFVLVIIGDELVAIKKIYVQ